MGDGFHARVSLPFGRAINPITGTNWEGTGVEPHVKVPAAESLGTAHELALDELSEGEAWRRRLPSASPSLGFSTVVPLVALYRRGCMRDNRR